MNVEIKLKEVTKDRPKKSIVYTGLTKVDIFTGYRGTKWLYLNDLDGFVDTFPLDEIESIMILDLS